MYKMENYPTTNKNDIQAYVNRNWNTDALRCQAEKAGLKMAGVPGLPSLLRDKKDLYAHVHWCTAPERRL